jgi:hypothetical protein
MLPNHKLYIAITVHFEEKGVPVCMLLDLIEVVKSHSGLNLAATFVKVLEDFGISDKVSFENPTMYNKFLSWLWLQILSVTCNNASNNDTMIDELKNLLTEFSGAASWTHCFAHIINLVAKTVIQQFDVPNSTDKTLADEVLKELGGLADGIKAEELIMSRVNHGCRWTCGKWPTGLTGMGTVAEMLDLHPLLDSYHHYCRFFPQCHILLSPPKTPTSRPSRTWTLASLELMRQWLLPSMTCQFL